MKEMQNDGEKYVHGCVSSAEGEVWSETRYW